ncbi:MAG: terminase gpA endonuclease subunit [Planctomycetota bacterium]
MIVSAPQPTPEIRLIDNVVRAVSIKPILSIVEFAESKIIIPDGEYGNRRFQFRRQPLFRHWFDAIDSGAFTTFVATGPVQSGKTLAVLIPVLYHLFELRETVIFGVPNREMAADKWNLDIKPVISACPEFEKLLPTSGQGSRQASKIETVIFKNGSVLKFMTGSGADETRSGFTSRVVAMTEADKLEVRSRASAETGPINQLEGRVAQYGSNARIYKECSPSLDTAHIWQAYLAGSQSEVAMKCPYCGEYSLVDREHFKGWETANTVWEAQETGRFRCPKCDEPWSLDDRRQAVEQGRLAHQAQTERAQVLMDPPRSRVFSFRWSAAQNLFIDEVVLGGKEFEAAVNRDDLDLSDEKDVLQQRWGMPYTAPKSEYVEAKIGDIMARQAGEDSGLRKGVIPSDATLVGVGVDVGKFYLHWAGVAQRPNRAAHVYDYGVIPTHADAMEDIDEAIKLALFELHFELSKGWTDQDGQVRHFNHYGVDAGNFAKEVVYPFVARTNKYGVLATKGWGVSNYRPAKYKPATRADKPHLVFQGDGWHVVRDREQELFRCNFDADKAKSRVKEGLALPATQPRGVSLFYAESPREHLTFAQHIASETTDRTFIPGRGWVEKHVVKSHANHWLDATAIASLMLDVEGAASRRREAAAGNSNSRRPVVTTRRIFGDT